MAAVRTDALLLDRNRQSSKRRTCASQKDLLDENEYLDYRFNNHRQLGGLTGLTALTMGFGQDEALAATNTSHR